MPNLEKTLNTKTLQESSVRKSDNSSFLELATYVNEQLAQNLQNAQNTQANVTPQNNQPLAQSQL